MDDRRRRGRRPGDAQGRDRAWPGHCARVPEGPLGLPAPFSGALKPGPKPSDFIGEDFVKLGPGVEKPDILIREYSPNATERMDQRGPSQAEIEYTVAGPLIVLRQTRGKFLYLSDLAGVAITDDGEVVTTYPASEFDGNIQNVLACVQGSAPIRVRRTPTIYRGGEISHLASAMRQSGSFDRCRLSVSSRRKAVIPRQSLLKHEFLRMIGACSPLRRLGRMSIETSVRP